MSWSPALPMGTGLEGGEGGERKAIREGSKVCEVF